MIKYDQIEDYIINNRALQVINEVTVADKANIYYHQNCMDGSCSAALMFHILRQKNIKNIELIPVNYNKEFPMEKVDEFSLCFMVDFSAPVEVLEKIEAKSNGLLIIDHHKTAVEAILKYQETTTPKFGYILAGTKHSGASLIHEVLINQLSMVTNTVLMEKIVDHCRIHDTWKHNGVITDPNYGFVTAVYGACEDTDKDQASKNMVDFLYRFISDADKLAHTTEVSHYANTSVENHSSFRTIVGLSNIGIQMLKFKELEAKAYIDAGTKVAIQQGQRMYNALVVVAPYRAASMVGSIGYNTHKDIDFVAIYEDKPDTDEYVISLRGSGVDVSEVAKFYGGGGHAGAAGFSIKKDQWEEIIQG